ncbi:hypothetical protein HPK20_15720 [Vibrio fluvialis]|nr:hypothetical protein [Vibrio fluvialis]QKE35947.1 hypothetical protein HPK20_15720 [Vibrio fluvialis]
MSTITAQKCASEDSDVRRDVEQCETTATTVTLTLAGDSATAVRTSPTRT